MAISKIIYKSSAEAEGEVWMDVTQKTVTSGTMLSGTTALKNDGTDITGSIATKTSANLSASGATVTAPAGYYATDASKSVASGTAGTPTATKGTVSSNSVTVTPSVTNTVGYISGGTLTGTAVTVSASELVSGTKNITASGITDVTNYASASVAAGSAATPATSITANPSISVSSGGLITASVSTSQSVTPTVSAGYVSSGTSGTVSVSGSNTEQLTTQAAQTIHPSTTDQTIASGKYLTGAQTVKGVLLTNLDAGNIKKDVVVKIGDSTDDDCVTSVTGTYEGGGGSSYVLLASADFTVNTSSTTATKVGSIACGASLWDANKIVYVRVRDKAGKRAGYFYGHDSYFLNTSAANGVDNAITVAARETIRYSSSGAWEVYVGSSSNVYGVYGGAVNKTTVDIYVRYSSSYSLTIDGTYQCDVYLITLPNGETPFDT